MPQDPASQSRPLGVYETLLATVAERLGGASQITVAVRIQGPLTEALLRRALALLQNRHPTLRAVLQQNVGVHQIEVREPGGAVSLTLYPKTADLDWHARYEAEMNCPLVATEGLWRVAFLPGRHDQDGHDLMVTGHHVAADGLSITHLIDELLGLLAQLDQGEAPSVTPLPLMPPIEDIRRQQPALDRFMADMAAYQAAQPRIRPWAYHRAAPIEERRCRAIHRYRDSPFVEGLLDRARAESTTVNAALGAAMLMAAAGRLESPLNTSLESVFDLRADCDPALGDETMGCYLTSIQVGLADIESDGDLWSLARRYRDAYRAGVTKVGYFPPDFDLAPILAQTEPALVSAQTEYIFALGLSNLGRYRGRESAGRFTLQHFYFGASRRAGFFSGFLHATTLDSGLCLSFCFAEPLLEAAWAEAYLDAVLDHLESAKRPS